MYKIIIHYILYNCNTICKQNIDKNYHDKIIHKFYQQVNPIDNAFLGKEDYMSDKNYLNEGLPLGFTARLAQNESALTKFGTLSSEQKDKIVSYIKDSKTGRQAKKRIEQTTFF